MFETVMYDIELIGLPASTSDCNEQKHGRDFVGDRLCIRGLQVSKRIPASYIQIREAFAKPTQRCPQLKPFGMYKF